MISNPTFYRFPDIEQFRNVIRAVKQKATYVNKDEKGEPIYNNALPLPTLSFHGTVKLHGTNCVIGYDSSACDIWVQSRERIITPENDNAGAAKFIQERERIFQVYALNIANQLKFDKVLFCGEYIGKGVQSGVAVAQMEKSFVLFAIKGLTGEESTWLSSGQLKEFFPEMPDVRLFNIECHKTYDLDVNFDLPEIAQNSMIQLVLDVESKCPFAADFGIEGVGEGIVWVYSGDKEKYKGLMFKTKGEKHSVSKVKTLVPIDIEKVNNLREFINNVVTENRCLQSLSKLKESGKSLDRTNLGEFIRWIFQDIIKEESDTAKANNIEIEKIGGEIAKSAKTWFFANESKFE